MADQANQPPPVYDSLAGPNQGIPRVQSTNPPTGRPARGRGFSNKPRPEGSNQPRGGGRGQPRGRVSGAGRGQPRQDKPKSDPPAGSAQQSASSEPQAPVVSNGERSNRNRQRGMGGRRPKKDSPAPKDAPAEGSAPPSDIEKAAEETRAPQSSRRRQFGSKLTENEGTSSSKQTVTVITPAAQELDLTSRLTASFSRSASKEEAPDCPICFNSISPGSPIWSCTPQTSDLDPAHAEYGSSNCCWSSYHLKCIKTWASRSVKATGEAYAARGVADRDGEWRCPGCQTKRSIVPPEYRCFCGLVVDPRPGRLSTPHSCGEGCGRSRDKCDHPCPL